MCQDLGMLKKLAFLAALGAAIPGPITPVHAQSAIKETVTIAVREDGRPFVWKDKKTNEFSGFFWDICTEAVTRAGYDFVETGIVPSTRSEFLEQGNGQIDLLCDPTTITLERMHKFSQGAGHPLDPLGYSPIVFVANGSHIRTKGDPEEIAGVGVIEAKDFSCATVLANAFRDAPQELSDQNSSNVVPVSATDGSGTEDVDDAKKAGGFLAWLDDAVILRHRPQPLNKRFEIWGFVGGTTSEATALKEARSSKTKESGVLACTQPLVDHDAAARAFCAGRLARYYGDVEIVRAAIEEHTDCAADFKPTESGTYEPYAFVTSNNKFAAFPERFDNALYGMFSDDSIERLFAGHFPGKRKSQFLKTLFRINSVPPGNIGADDG